MASPALTAILDAHGGLDRWRSIDRVEVEMSAGGFLFTSKRIPPQRHARLSISTRRPESVLFDYPAVGRRTTLCGADRVEVRDGDDHLVQVRDNPRAEFSPLLWKPWDAIDFAYFSGYAMWNYLSLPFLLTMPGVRVEVAGGVRAGTVLDVEYPTGIPTHCARQRLFFDISGRLVRHDYTAEVVGGWARAVHLCSQYREFDGFWLPTRRRVYPRGPFGWPLPGPILVAVDIHDVWTG